MKIKMEKSFYGEFCQWPDEITAHLSDTLRQRISEIQSLIEASEDIKSVDIAVPPDFFDGEEYEQMQIAGSFDVERLTVYRGGYCLSIQGKYDSHIQAEYVTKEEA